MIREQRSKEKLAQYYHNFITEGVIDPNIHPWVAESWLRSRAGNVPADYMSDLPKLDKAGLAVRRSEHKAVIDYLQGLYEQIKEHFTTNNLSLLLLDSECYVLKSYAMPFFQKTAGELEGTRVAEQDIGTSSISVAYEHKTPFLMFGPEMWIAECHSGDACSVPVMVEGQLKYMITLVAVEQSALPSDSVVALLLSMKYAVETFIALMDKLEVRQAILDTVPLAVYHLLPGGEVGYTNKSGLDRLSPAKLSAGKPPNLKEVVLNYNHMPLAKGFKGIPSYNREVTWITARKTYEDITTVVPLVREREVRGVVAISLPVETLRNLVAHAAGYTARYSLNSMVGRTSQFRAMKDKAARAARGEQHILLQGEAGTGKERLAHGIHQASSRAAGPLIVLKCGDMPREYFEEELFGITDQAEHSRRGKLELAGGGTLFVDEVEKIPFDTALKLAAVLASGGLKTAGEGVGRPAGVRIIAACDGDLKRLTDKNLFCGELYALLSNIIIRVPSLRSRRDDVPVLARHIVAELADQHLLPEKTITPEAAELLRAYDWPGNIKQLQGVMEHAFFNTGLNYITPAAISPLGIAGPGDAWKEDREEFIEAWQAAGENVSRLAGMLDVSRVTLYRYLKKYGLDRKR